MRKKRVAIGCGLAVLGLAVGAVGYIGPRNVIGMLRYDTRREGALQVGDRAPPVELLALDGTTRVQLSEQLHGRPLVLIFGSFT
jgi:hypothetical protein